mmetsp:Transcript_88816/g.248599  ORF Transcript_88816/g.248599 Transcript_88816/m.248599 type:complete len:263 (-) Transcript_88816:2-790(-)
MSDAAATTAPRSSSNAAALEGWRTRASTRTPSPTSRMAGARMKTAGKLSKARRPAASASSVGSSEVTGASKDSVWRPKKFLQLEMSIPPIWSPYLHRFASVTKPASPERPPPPPLPLTTARERRMQPAQVPQTGCAGRLVPSVAFPPSTYLRRLSMKVSVPAMIFIVVDSPPGITSESHASSSGTVRTWRMSSCRTSSSGRDLKQASCSSKAPCSARIPSETRRGAPSLMHMVLDSAGCRWARRTALRAEKAGARTNSEIRK